MTTGSREDVQAHNATLVEAYWQGESAQAIALRAGRSISTINKLVSADLKANGPRTRARKPRDPRVMHDKSVLSDRHAWIGLNIARYRAEHDLTPTQFGMEINQSRVIVRNMEVGAHDFTLTQIEQLSKLFDIPFATLVKDTL